MEELNINLCLKEVRHDDSVEGLKFLQELVNEEGIMVAPAPKDIDESSYGTWLKAKEDMGKRTDAHWI